MPDELTGDQVETPESTAGAEEAAAEPTLADVLAEMKTVKDAMAASEEKNIEALRERDLEISRLRGHIEARELPEERFNLSTVREYDLALDGMEATSRVLEPDTDAYRALYQKWELGKAERARFIAHQSRQAEAEEKTALDVDRFLAKRDIDPESEEGQLARWAAKHGMGLDRFTEKVLDPLDKYNELVAVGEAAGKTSENLTAANEISETEVRADPPAQISKTEKTGHAYAQDDLVRRYETRHLDVDERMFGPQG